MGDDHRNRGPASGTEPAPAGSDSTHGERREPVPLAVWGPSAAGKTVLLAQLYLEHHRDGDWEIFPTQASLAFIRQMRDWRLQNRFPPATAVGQKEQIVYVFRHRRLGVEASLQVEDRAGRDYEQLEADGQQRLNSAAGLVMLIDPRRNPLDLKREVSQLLETMNVARAEAGRKDSRPIAVCISKADLLIDTADDYEQACTDPDGFVRRHEEWGLLPLLERFCNNYRLFPLSAVGVRVQYGEVEPVTFYDETLTLRIGADGRPFNLMVPFAWLIEQVTAGS